MAVKIRLQRCGARHAPVYRMVAADARKPRDGRFIEALGIYNPKARGQTKEIELKLDRIDYWVGVGAQFTDTARSLVKRARRSGEAESDSESDVPKTASVEQSNSSGEPRSEPKVAEKDQANLAQTAAVAPDTQKQNKQDKAADVVNPKA